MLTYLTGRGNMVSILVFCSYRRSTQPCCIIYFFDTWCGYFWSCIKQWFFSSVCLWEITLYQELCEVHEFYLSPKKKSFYYLSLKKRMRSLRNMRNGAHSTREGKVGNILPPLDEGLLCLGAQNRWYMRYMSKLECSRVTSYSSGLML